MLGARVLREVESYAAAMLASARIDSGNVPSIHELSKYLLGVAPRFRDQPEAGVLYRSLTGEWRLWVREGTPAQRARWVAAHELAHWWWENEIGYRGRDIEARCDALGAALVAPVPLLVAARARHGRCLECLATSMRTTQSLALLRLGECMGEPVALVRRSRSTIIRGPFIRWPAPLRWESLETPGIAKIAILDEPHRFGVAADLLGRRRPAKLRLAKV